MTRTTFSGRFGARSEMQGLCWGHSSLLRACFGELADERGFMVVGCPTRPTLADWLVSQHPSHFHVANTSEIIRVTGSVGGVHLKRRTEGCLYIENEGL